MHVINFLFISVFKRVLKYLCSWLRLIRFLGKVQIMKQHKKKCKTDLENKLNKRKVKKNERKKKNENERTKETVFCVVCAEQTELHNVQNEQVHSRVRCGDFHLTLFFFYCCISGIFVRLFVCWSSLPHSFRSRGRNCKPKFVFFLTFVIRMIPSKLYARWWK